MKAISTTWMLLLVLGLVSSPVFAIEYCKDFLESGNPGGWSASLKTFDDEWMMEVGDEVELDIWINDVPLSLLSGGFWIEYDPSEVSIISVSAYDGYDIPGTGPWEVAFTVKVFDPGGPGTYMVSVGPPLMPATPDNDGDIIIAKVRFRCEMEGDATITISTIPGLDTFVGDTTVFDPEIIPNTITIHQIMVDSDADGIPDHEDNCPLIPNGPDLGSCAERWCSNIVCVTSACLNEENCEYNEICQINQEDADSDGMGDVCDPCPNSADQEDNYPPGGNGIGDACECEGDFDYDGNMDGYDAAIFKTDFGRSIYINPCTNEWLCNGDFDCDRDVDGGDAALFKEDYGRSPYHCLNCPCREVEQWCVYSE